MRWGPGARAGARRHPAGMADLECSAECVQREPVQEKAPACRPRRYGASGAPARPVGHAGAAASDDAMVACAKGLHDERGAGDSPAQAFTGRGVAAADARASGISPASGGMRLVAPEQDVWAGHALACWMSAATPRHWTLRSQRAPARTPSWPATPAGSPHAESAVSWSSQHARRDNGYVLHRGSIGGRPAHDYNMGQPRSRLRPLLESP